MLNDFAGNSRYLPNSSINRFFQKKPFGAYQSNFNSYQNPNLKNHTKPVRPSSARPKTSQPKQ